MDNGGSLIGRRALITGASRGIGREIAVRYAAEGAAVTIVARSEDRLAEVADEIRRAGGSCTVIAADLTDPEVATSIVEQATAAMGGLDILVNNAGGNSFSTTVETMRYSGWRKTMELNLDSIVRLIQAALPALKDSGNASIINVSSVAGMRGIPFMAHYGAAKAALISLTRTLAIELGTSGVRVNALVPGWIETDLTEFLRADEGMEHAVLDRVPMARWGRADEIASGAVFLAGDASSFMTGQSLVLDGGLTAW